MNTLSKLLEALKSRLTPVKSTTPIASNGQFARFISSKRMEYGNVILIDLYLQFSQNVSAGTEYLVAYLSEEMGTEVAGVCSSNAGFPTLSEDGKTLRLISRNNYTANTYFNVRIMTIKS